MNTQVVIVSGVRTPFGKFGGSLRDMSSVELAALTLRESLRRADVPGSDVDEVYYGSCMAAEVALHQNTPARQVVLKAGLPPTTVSMTIDRACCSSTTAVQLGYRSIRAGFAETVVAMGAENMSNVPLLLPGTRWGHRPGTLKTLDLLFELGYPDWTPVALDAGEVALEHNVSRELQDGWALRSQQRYSLAASEARFAEEIVPVTIRDQRRGTEFVMDQDESPKAHTTLEGLQRLPTVYGSPTVTAGNAPGFDAGSAALVLMSGDRADRLQHRPLARICGAVSVAVGPRRLAEAPAEAISKVLREAAMSLDAIELFEINEAFAAVPLVSTRILAGGDPAIWQQLQDRTNVHGGAVAIGHPVGASGARLILTLALQLRRGGFRYGVAAICGGLGQADAILIESLPA